MNRYVNIGLSCATAALLGVSVLSAQAPAQGRGAGAAASDSAAGPVELSTVRIPRAVKADGKPLPSGTYAVRVTTTEAQPAAAGQTPQYERWAEFLQGGQVKGREVVSVVPAKDIAEVADGKAPASGSYKVELLKDNEYLRLWVNRGGNHYLVHFAL